MSTATLPRLWPRRLFRFSLWSFAALITLYALLCAWLTWAGTRALDRAIARITADGETLDFKKLLPPALDPATNFCAIPALHGITQVIDNDSDKGIPGAKRQALVAMKLEAKSEEEPMPRYGNGPALGHDDSLDEWINWLRKTQAIAIPTASSGSDAADLRQAIETAHPIIKDIASAAVQRTDAQFTPGFGAHPLPGNLFSLLLPHYAGVMPLTKLLELHAQAAFQSNDSAAALADIQAIHRIATACQHEPLLISLLVSANCQSRSHSAIWHGLKQQSLTDAQLSTLQADLARIDNTEATLDAFRGEVAAASGTLADLATKPSNGFSELITIINTNGLNDGPNAIQSILAYLAPRSLIHWNHATLLDIEYDGFIRPAKQGGLAAIFRNQAALDASLRAITEHPIQRLDGMFTALAVPAIGGIATKLIAIETQRRQATLACALEHYYLQQKHYPTALAELVPQFIASIPTDLLDDQPLRYARTPAGRYKIWATGFDGKDDNGQVNLADPKSTSTTPLSKPDYKGDWTWQYEPTPIPRKPAPIPAFPPAP